MVRSTWIFVDAMEHVERHVNLDFELFNTLKDTYSGTVMCLCTHLMDTLHFLEPVVPQ